MTLPIVPTPNGGVAESVFGNVYLDAGTSDLVQEAYDTSGQDLATFARAIQDQVVGGNWGHIVAQDDDGGSAGSTMVAGLDGGMAA